MSTESNVYSQGGGGTHYEFEVHTAYFINFIIGGTVPGLSDSHVIEFRQQSGSLGYKTDDLFLRCIDANSVEHSVLFQIKHNLIISENNELFREVLENAWADFKNASLFNNSNDKIYIVKSNLTLNEKNHLKQLLNWAKLKSSLSDFQNEVFRIDAKKKYFDLFKNTLQQIDKAVSDAELFMFFKCFDILEYDFGHEASISKAHFLTLIELSKANANSTARQIWDNIFAFVSNSDSKGGFFTSSGLPVEITSYFKDAYYNPTVRKLKKMSLQNFEIIQFIEDTIGGINLKREQVFQEAVEKLNNNKFLILSGDPGTGKSAVAKALLENINQSNNGFILTFKADELTGKNIRDIFLPFDITLTIKEIFSHFPLNQYNVIYIDSAEKLLEGEGTGFKQLLTSVQDIQDIKFILSCRSANLNLIERKFFYNKPYEKLDVPLLTALELEELETQLPIIQKLKANNRILSLIKNPKYLDFAVKAIPASADNFSESNEIEFINYLWEAIVENKLNSNYDGLPLRRSNLFIELAVRRAKLMRPFITFDTADQIALSNLEKENIIVKSSNTNSYAPAHDVLEDWALVRYVSKHFSDIQNDSDFFDKLGTEPAMRRAYRLWVQNLLKEQDIPGINFFTRNLSNASLDRFWQDESLIAVLNSVSCQSFFDQNIDLLKKNDWRLFFRIVHVMRTACRENSQVSGERKYLIPTGFGWVPVIKMMQQNIAEIPEVYHSLIINTISDWSNKILLDNTTPDGIREAGLAILYLLNNNYLKNSDYPDEDNNVEKCICLLFDLCGGIIPEVEEILKKAIEESKKEETDANWILKRYHDKIIELSLSGLRSGNLSKYLPDLVLTIAKEKWYKKPKKKSKEKDGLFSFLSEHHNPGDVNHHFGLVDEFKIKYFPASAYQTPVLWLLRHHPFKALDFIIELINITTEKYLKSEFSENDGCADVELTLYDNSTITQHGSSVLWSMYRGTGKVTPYLLQSVLMGLEQYLLEVAGLGDGFKEHLQKLLHILYTKSNSIATTGVISSICQAYPLLVDDKVLPLFTHRKLISWDVSRFTHDFHPLSLMFNNDAYERERAKSDKLPHRLKYTPGIKGFIVDHCFNIRTLNNKIFEILDTHRKSASPDDLEWKKILDDMDIRTWRLTKEIEHDGETKILIEPSYDEEIQAYLDETKTPFEESNKNVTFKVWLMKVGKKEDLATIEKWQEIFLYYKSLTEFDSFEHSPGLLAAIGIRDVWDSLSMEDKEWCIITVVDIANKIIEKQNRPYGFSQDISAFDDDGVMSVIPLFLSLPELQESSKDVDQLLIDLLITHFALNDSGYSKFLKSFSENVWSNSPAKALQFFKGVILFAKFTKANPFYIDHPYTEEQVADYSAKRNSLINKIHEKELDFHLDDITLSEYSIWFLKKAISIIPNFNPPIESIDFLKKMIQIYIQDEGKGRHSGDYDNTVYELRIILTEKISNIIFWSIDSAGGDLMEYFLGIIQNIDVLNKALKNNNQIFIFFRNTVTNLILITDNNLPEKEPDKIIHTISNFQKTWNKFENILSTQKIPLFADLLLLEIKWNENSFSWKPIESMSDFFERNITKYGPTNPQAVINLFSHIGDKIFLPAGINLLVDILKKSTGLKPISLYNYSEKLINRIYENHLTLVKNDNTLLNNYLWLLDEMTSQGSSDAYWIREFLVSFK